MRSRFSQTLILLFALLIGALSPLAYGPSLLAQTDEGTPPLIEPSDGEAAEQPTDQGSGTLELGTDLGSGGQPEGYPREVTLDGARYLFDRMVPATRQDLAPVGNNGEVQAFAESETGPFDALFISVPPRNDDELGRYLPEGVGESDIACLAEAGDFGLLDAGGPTYAFAGTETFLTPDDLAQVASDSNGQPVYADPGTEQPFPELYFSSDNGLTRFILTVEDGRPAPFAESLAFDGTVFAFAADVTNDIDPSQLAKAGCAGPFPVYTDADPATGNRYVIAAQQAFQFTGEAAAEPTTEPATPAPTTAPATPEPPTATPEPPTATQEPPTATAEPPTATAEPPTATLEPPTATPAPPTEEPTATAEPATPEPTAPAESTATEAPEGEATSTQAAATEPQATEVPATDVPDNGAVPTVPVPATVAEAASAANAPEQVRVQGTTYYFSSVEVDIDITTLTQIEVVTVNDIELTVYAETAFTGVAPQLYCADAEGNLVGVYVPAAETEPAPPEQLPPTIEVNNTTYVFNEVDVTVNVTNLTQVEVTTINNIEVTIYADVDVQGEPTRYYAVASDGAVVGQYVSVNVVVVVQPTQQLQPPAYVPTQPADAPPPAAVTAVAETACSGNPGPINAQGLPTYLPNRIQLGGVSYALAGPQAPAEAGTLTRIGCIGAFEIATTDQADRSEVLYLRYVGAGEAAASVYRFERATTFGVEFEVTGNAQRIQSGDQVFRLTAVWTMTIHSSASVNLFTADPEATSSDIYYGVNVANTVVGDVIGEYRKANAQDEPAAGMVEAGERYGLNPDLTIRGQRYLLVNVFIPVGTTTNGFLTLFSSTGEGEVQLLLGRDKRELELFIYEPIDQPTGG